MWKKLPKPLTPLFITNGREVNDEGRCSPQAIRNYEGKAKVHIFHLELGTFHFVFLLFSLKNLRVSPHLHGLSFLLIFSFALFAVQTSLINHFFQPLGRRHPRPVA